MPQKYLCMFVYAIAGCIVKTKETCHQLQCPRIQTTDLITTRTSPTSTTHTFNNLVFFQLRLGHAADTRRAEVCFFGLDAFETAELVSQHVV